MNTNRSNVTETAFTNIDNEKFSKNFDHIFNREKCQCEECEKEKEEKEKHDKLYYRSEEGQVMDSSQAERFYSERMEKYRDQNVELQEEILHLKNKVAIAWEALRFIRTSCDCRNESENEQCAHVAEAAMSNIDAR